MREGGVDAMVFAVYVPQAARTAAGYAAVHALALGHFERTHQQLARCRAECGLALTADDALRLKAEGRRAVFLSIENSYSLGCDPANVEKFFKLGVRMIGLTHMLNNDLADSSTDPRGPEWRGLSPLGREMVAECNRLGIVVDASHASDEVLCDLLDHSRAPVMLSHSDCRAVCDHPRNIGDDLLRALAAKGGVLQMNALPISLVDAPGNARTAASAEILMRFRDEVISPEMLAASDREYHRVAKDHPNPKATLDDLLRHLEHAVAVVGADHVGIGCDLDGGGGWFEGLRDVSDFPNITKGLVARGWGRRRWQRSGVRARYAFRAVQRSAG
jgi:membrane dipeptidase